PPHPASLNRPILVYYNNTESDDSVLDAHNIIQLIIQAVAESVVRQRNGRTSKHMPSLACDVASKPLHRSCTLVHRSALRIYVSISPQELFFKDHPAAARQSRRLSPAGPATNFEMTRQNAKEKPPWLRQKVHHAIYKNQERRCGAI